MESGASRARVCRAARRGVQGWDQGAGARWRGEWCWLEGVSASACFTADHLRPAVCPRGDLGPAPGLLQSAPLPTSVSYAPAIT